jgi:phosphonate transport system substrate-binding protein
VVLKPFTALVGILAVLAAVLCEDVHASTSGREMYFGSVAMDIPAIMHKRLQPLTRYLSAGLDRPVTLKLSSDMKSAIEDISRGSVGLAYLTPVAYLKAHTDGGARLVVKTVTEGKGSFQLMIVVKDDSPIKSVADLKGSVFAFGDKAALLQRAVVVNSGINLEDFKTYKFIGHYDNIVRGVINGDFDAGILKDTMAYKWQGKGIRILYASPALPPYNISVSKDVDEKTYKKLKDLLLRLNSQDPRHLEIIHALDVKYNGFTAVEDGEYDIVRKLIKPFEAE